MKKFTWLALAASLLFAVPAQAEGPMPGGSKLIFTTGRLGSFVVVGMRYDGLEFSEGFYEALGNMEEVKKLG